MTARQTRPVDLTRLGWVAVALAAVTGLVHLALGVGALPAPLGVASLLAAGGFATGIAVLFAGVRRRTVLAAFLYRSGDDGGA